MIRQVSILLVSLLFLCSPAFGEKISSPKNHLESRVLILNSYHPGHAWSDGQQSTIIQALRAEKLDNAPIIEYLDFKRLPKGEHLEELRALMRKGLQHRKISLVMAIGNPALDFAITNHHEIFRNAPIVFCGARNFTQEILMGDNRVTGSVKVFDIAGTIEAMLQITPRTRTILVLNDYTAAGRAFRQELESLLPRFTDTVAFRFVANLPIEDIYRELESLPQDTLVLLLSYTTDSEGKTYHQEEVTRVFSQHSTVPIYDHSAVRLGHGIVGGKLSNPQDEALAAVKLAGRILRGEDVRQVPVAYINSAQYMFDYQQLQRFHIPQAALPPQSVVINKPPSFYEAHRSIILTAAGIIFVLSLVIFLLVVHIIYRRKAALALQASEARYYDLYENAPDMYYSLDLKTATVTACNNTFVQATGYPREEIIGRPILEFYHPACREEVRLSFQRFALTGEVCNAERKVQRKDGHTIDVSLNVSAIRDGNNNLIHTRSIWRDIGESKKMQELILLAKNSWEETFDAINDAITVHDLDFNVVRANKAARAILRLPFGDVVGQKCFKIYHGLSYALPGCLSCRTLKTGQPSTGKIFEPHLGKHLEVKALPRFNKRNKVIGLVHVVRDITDQVKAEQEQQELQSQLLHAQKMEAVGTLASSVAHDLNNMLGALFSYTELLQKKIPAGDPLRTYTDNILKSAEKGAATIHDLLTQSRRGVLAPVVFNTNSIIADFAQSPLFAKVQADHPQVTFRIYLAPHSLHVKGSPLHLEKVVMNLLMNGAEAISGPGEVTIRTESRYLDKPVQRYDSVKEGEYVVLTVSDTGGGIGSEDREKIFEPFYTKKVMGWSGTGLGLTIVRDMVKDHNGYIDVESELGRGTTFTLFFPLTGEEQSGTGLLETDGVRKMQELGTGAYLQKPCVMEEMGLASKTDLNR